MQKYKWKVFINEPMDNTEKTHIILEEAGCELILGRSMWEHPGWAYKEEEMINIARGVDAVIGSSRDYYTRNFMQACTNLRVISKYGIGVEKIDIKAASELGILVTHTPVPEDFISVSEQTIAFILSLFKKIKIHENHVRKGKWRGYGIENIMIKGKTIGLIGFGRIGKMVAKRLQNWDVKILCHDPHVEDEVFNHFMVEQVELEKLLQKSDAVSMHVVATPETRNMIGENELRLMKNTAIIINTSRGEVINETALITALEKGWIAGAGLDVTNPEPPQINNPLLSMDNVIITPHTAGWSFESIEAIINAGMENCLSALRGKDPLYIKNPEVLPFWRERFIK